MTDERQAVKTLAENLVKAMKSVSSSTPSNVIGGSNPNTINASKIVGLPAAFASMISGVESAAASGDAVAQQTLSALNHIAAGEFETITADTAMIEKVYASFGDFITLVAEDAQIGDLDVDTIRAGLADIGLLNIGSATITTAQIERASTGTLFVRDEVGGKVYIDDLAVSEANIVNLAAGTVLINDSNGDLVELYVDAQSGNVTTRPVSYDGNDIIDANTLNGNRIIQNSITADRLNASEIFASQGTIMDLISDNINTTRLFAQEGFIPQLESTIISSAAIGEGLDLSSNSTITLLQDSINLLSSNTSRTFIQTSEPFPVHMGDTWFDPSTEDHYVSTGIIIPQMNFGHDDGGNLCNIHTEDYQFSLNSNGELEVLVINENAERIIIENDLDFEIVDDRVYVDGLWKKIENVAFSNLKISVDGIVSEVYDSQTGVSRIAQNAESITLAVRDIATESGRIDGIEGGTTAVPYVETSSIKIKNNKVEIKSTGDVDIKANKFSISFNTAGALSNKSRVDISDSYGIKVSDSYGNYFQATSTEVGLYDINDNPKLYMDSSGNAHFAGELSAATGTFAGKLSAATGTFAGTMSANCITSGTLDTKVITAHSIAVEKLTGNIANGAWNIDLNAGTFTIGNISATKITSGTMTADRISGGTLNLGGSGDTNGVLTVKNASNKEVVRLDKYGITVYNGTAKQFYVDNNGNARFAGVLNAATGTFEGTMSAACITSGTMSAARIKGGELTLGGGGNNTKGRLIIQNANGDIIGTWDNNGITIKSKDGSKSQITTNSNGDIVFSGNLNAAGGTFAGNISAATGTFKGGIQITRTDGKGYFQATGSKIGFYDSGDKALLSVSNNAITMNNGVFISEFDMNSIEEDGLQVLNTSDYDQIRTKIVDGGINYYGKKNYSSNYELIGSIGVYTGGMSFISQNSKRTGMIAGQGINYNKSEVSVEVNSMGSGVINLAGDILNVTGSGGKGTGETYSADLGALRLYFLNGILINHELV